MRAYVRTTFKRLGDAEVRRALEAGSDDAGRPVPEREARPGTPAHWGRFVRVFERIVVEEAPAGQRSKLSRLAWCARLDLTRVHRCGREAPALDGGGSWCGLPLCPACARREAAHAAAWARERWDPRVLVVEVPIGRAPGEGLPGAEPVASVRAAWGRATRAAAGLTGFERLEPLPRAVLHPGGVTLFSPLPWDAGVAPGLARAAEETLETALRQACRDVGLRARARVSSREAAALELRRALLEEASRFALAIERDVTRLADLCWRGVFPSDASLEAALRAVARRWLERVRQRHRSLRRKRSLGGRGALSLSGAPPRTFTPAVCPDHGAGCPVEATRVRDLLEHGREVERRPGNALPAAARPHLIAASLTAAAAVRREESAAPPRVLERLLPAPDVASAITARFRMAG